MAGTRLETVFSYAILALFSLAVVLPVGWLLLAATSPKANAGVDLAEHPAGELRRRLGPGRLRPPTC